MLLDAMAMPVSLVTDHVNAHPTGKCSILDILTNQSSDFRDSFNAVKTQTVNQSRKTKQKKHSLTWVVCHALPKIDNLAKDQSIVVSSGTLLDAAY